MKVRGELQNKEKEARDKMELEKEREKEKVGAEAADDLKFSTTLGMMLHDFGSHTSLICRKEHLPITISFTTTIEK